ncbi:MAG: NAD(P)/FAD-dependent oxidoreductase [Sporolactobacillus sp.]|jgi:NADH dehydrogenase|nr:NAD(P)/FAD-dependent oxidoreductase [Sporolactobacillus sp.]
MNKQHIVIVGAGYAGVHAAKKLARAYKHTNAVSITLIDRHPFQTMLTAIHEVAAHRAEPEAVQLDLHRLFREKVACVTAIVKRIDFDRKTVVTEEGSYPYDELILSLGGEPNDIGVPGVKEHGFTLWSLEDAVKLRNHIDRTIRRAMTVSDARLRRTLLTFTICGSGFTGVEMIGELLDLKNRLKVTELDKNEITFVLVEALPTILNLFDRKSAAKAENYLLDHGVKIMKSTAITEIDADRVVFRSGQSLPTATLIWTAGIQANALSRDFGMTNGPHGRLKVNQYMQAVGLDHVYVAGDCSWFERCGKPTPQIVEAAEQTAGTAAQNIIASIDGGQKVAFHGHYHGIVVSIGSKYAVANLMGLHLSGPIAAFMKRCVNLYYFICIRSGYYLFRYLTHGFFPKKKRVFIAPIPDRQSSAHK